MKEKIVVEGKSAAELLVEKTTEICRIQSCVVAVMSKAAQRMKELDEKLIETREDHLERTAFIETLLKERSYSEGKYTAMLAVSEYIDGKLDMLRYMKG